jgi:small subunit ribosomal protein S21
MTRVIVRNGNVEGALKKFKQKVSKDGTFQENKKRGYYEKPGVQKRNARKEAIKNSHKKSRDM